MVQELAQLLDWASKISSIGWLFLGLYGGYRGWYVWRPHYEAALGREGQAQAREQKLWELYLQTNGTLQEAQRQLLLRPPAPPRRG